MGKRKLLLKIYTTSNNLTALVDFKFPGAENECFCGYVEDKRLLINKNLPWEISRNQALSPEFFKTCLSENPMFLGDTEAKILTTLEQEELTCLLSK